MKTMIMMMSLLTKKKENIIEHLINDYWSSREKSKFFISRIKNDSSKYLFGKNIVAPYREPVGGNILFCVRRCPSLPQPPGCSTIGAGGLDFRVRNETGYFPSAMTTETNPVGVCSRSVSYAWIQYSVENWPATGSP